MVSMCLVRPTYEDGVGLFFEVVSLVAVPYCNKCSRKIDPYRPKCPKCGSVVRFRFIDESRDVPAQEEEPGFIRPPWKVEAD